VEERVDFNFWFSVRYIKKSLKTKFQMLKKNLILLAMIFTISPFAQNKNEEILVNRNGVIIDSINEDRNLKFKTYSEVLNEFYFNQKNIKSLDRLISFRFYQKTPYFKFKETMESKFLICGKFKDFKIIETEFSQDQNSIRIKCEVQYEKVSTIEQIIMIKETEKSNFLIYEYDIKTNK
jgi:hypothetical protein